MVIKMRFFAARKRSSSSSFVSASTSASSALPRRVSLARTEDNFSPAEKESKCDEAASAQSSKEKSCSTRSLPFGLFSAKRRRRRQQKLVKDGAPAAEGSVTLSDAEMSPASAEVMEATQDEEDAEEEVPPVVEEDGPAAPSKSRNSVRSRMQSSVATWLVRKTSSPIFSWSMDTSLSAAVGKEFGNVVRDRPKLFNRMRTYTHTSEFSDDEEDEYDDDNAYRHEKEDAYDQALSLRSLQKAHSSKPPPQAKEDINKNNDEKIIQTPAGSPAGKYFYSAASAVDVAFDDDDHAHHLRVSALPNNEGHAENHKIPT